MNSSLPKRPTAIAFAPCGTLVVGDAFGDVFRLPQSGTVDTRDDDSGDDARALGHFSTVTTVCVTDGMIATADRDARIRISRWPNTFVIETFCMGHADAITALSVVTGGWVSGAADGVVKLWDESGRCRATVDVVEAGVPLRIARNDGVVSACSHEKGEEKDNGEKDADMEKPIVSTVAVCGTKRNRVVFAVDGSRSIYVLSGVNEGRLENCRQLTTFDDTVSGVSVDGDGMIWVSLSSRVELSWIRMKDVQDDNGDMVADKGTVKIVCEERLEKSKGNGGEGAGEGRFVWLAKQRKRAMTDEWKGKKRKHVEI